MMTNADKDLLSYFTDVEHIRDWFKNAISRSTLEKRILVLHGVGGVGKSSLLRMLRLQCIDSSIPVGFSSGDEAKSIVDVLTMWMEGFAPQLKQSAFRKTLEQYQTLQAKVSEQTKKSSSKLGDIAGKATSKTAETASGALVGAALGSVIPGIGTAIGSTLGSVIGGMSAEAMVDWLRSFLSKPEIDLVLNPTKALTSDFLVDVTTLAAKQRLVLILDTFEQMSALEDWLSNLAQQLHPNVLLVIAGRKLPDWHRTWQSWMSVSHVEELKPMTKAIMRDLIRRYYATMRGGQPDPTQVEAIIEFARGLPMVVTGAVQLWVKYGVEDFQAVKPEIVANLVDRLIEGVPAELVPLLEAAATVRWFDQPILRAVTGLSDVRDLYNELRRFPFVRTRSEGLALHDAVREMLDENLRVQDQERHAGLHERAAQYFEKRLEKATGDEADRLSLERLYHRIRADERSGMVLFQEMAENLAQYRLISRLQVILNDVNTYPIDQENSKLWREYYNARLNHLNTLFTQAEQTFQDIGYNEKNELKLRAYALCDLGQILRSSRLQKEAVRCFRTAFSLYPIDAKLAAGFLELSATLGHLGDYEGRRVAILQAQEFYTRTNNIYGEAISLIRLFKNLQHEGLWKQSIDALEKARKKIWSIDYLLPSLKKSMVQSFGYSRVWLGQWHKIEKELLEIYPQGNEIDQLNLVYYFRDLGLICGVQEKYDQSYRYFDTAISYCNDLRSDINYHERMVIEGARSYILLRQGKLGKVNTLLMDVLNHKVAVRDYIGVPEISNWIAEWYEVSVTNVVLQELTHKYFEHANSYYQKSLEFKKVGRKYFEIAALVGLVRVKFGLNEYVDIPPLVIEADTIAQQNEYNDHLASLHLTQAHMAWELGNHDEVLPHYQKALIYALRFNRFLLDEVLSGRPQGTPLRPIIPYCRERGEEGNTMLQAIRDWWQTGMNDTGTLRPDTISPLPEGIPLLEAENIAREREPGTGAVQKTVLEQLDKVLG